MTFRIEIGTRNGAYTHWVVLEEPLEEEQIQEVLEAWQKLCPGRLLRVKEGV